MAIIMKKATKGHIVALQELHSSHDVKMKKSEYETFTLAKATKVNKDGRVMSVRKIGYVSDTKIDPTSKGERVWLISDPLLQDMAREIFDASPMGTTWKTSAELKAEIQARILPDAG